MNMEFLESDYDKVSYLVNLLTECATGNSVNTKEYETLRYELLSNQELAPLLPDWLKVHRTLTTFWGFIKNNCATYAERRTFLAEEFSRALNALEFDNDFANSNSSESKSNMNANTVSVQDKKIFIVHGRDNETKQEVARFIESLGIGTIILHEQASGGMTIIEKIEHYADESNYALVLYTACDLGRGIHESKIHPKNRARQKVVFEHGYLMAKLGRRNVCALVKGEIETPNDISGVVYVGLDQAGGWKNEVIKELKACGYKV
ncbi:TIR domain-containing protein [Gimesia sp.]|uniref:TIR domain-containing protein n=1 Tax=Gimesia sp. TaxID=2024833 RepID=UPI003A94BE88